MGRRRNDPDCDSGHCAIVAPNMRLASTPGAVPGRKPELAIVDAKEQGSFVHDVAMLVTQDRVRAVAAGAGGDGRTIISTLPRKGDSGSSATRTPWSRWPAVRLTLDEPFPSTSGPEERTRKEMPPPTCPSKGRDDLRKAWPARARSGSASLKRRLGSVSLFHGQVPEIIGPVRWGDEISS
jgi:hypothetical protein